jgi:hypothetical protein
MPAPHPKGQAARPLWNALKRLDPSVECEKTFDWLFVPGPDQRMRHESEVHAALVEHCRTTRTTHPKKSNCNCDGLYAMTPIGRARTLEFDFFLPQSGVAIEFDERQHFTKERRLTLNFYATDFPFDVERWKLLCSDRIVDPVPPCRDWQRAFRDTIRDFRAKAHGVKLLRIYYQDFNGASEHARSALIQTIVQ